MTAVQLPAVNQTPAAAAGLTPEVFTVSGLLSMPAVWTAVVERALPVNVLLERFLIVLLTCTLVAELVRRLGEGGALGPGVAHAGAAATRSSASPSSWSAADGPGDPDGDSGSSFETDPLSDDVPGALDGAEAPFALDARLAPLAGFDDLGDLDDLPPLDLDADPF